MFFLDLNPSTQKNKGSSDLKFHNDFKDLGVDLNVVVDCHYSSVVTSQAPPNLPYAIVVADLLKPIEDYSSVVDIVVEWHTVEAQQGPKLSNDFNGLHGGVTVRQSHLTVAEWWCSHGGPWIYCNFHYKNHRNIVIKFFLGSWWREA